MVIEALRAAIASLGAHVAAANKEMAAVDAAIKRAEIIRDRRILDCHPDYRN